MYAARRLLVRPGDTRSTRFAQGVHLVADCRRSSCVPDYRHRRPRRAVHTVLRVSPPEPECSCPPGEHATVRHARSSGTRRPLPGSGPPTAAGRQGVLPASTASARRRLPHRNARTAVGRVPGSAVAAESVDAHQVPGCQVRPGQVGADVRERVGRTRGPSGAKIIAVAGRRRTAPAGVAGRRERAPGRRAGPRTGRRRPARCRAPSPPCAPCSSGAYWANAGSGSSSRPV